MIDDTSDETADLWVEQISGEYRLRPLRPVTTPNLTPLPPTPPYPTPTPTPTSTPMVTPTPAAHYKNAKWPDGRMLIHPEHFVKAYVINVAPDDKLELRSGPVTMYRPVTEIPPNGTDIIVFDEDGNFEWFPVEWHGFRGYVGRKYICRQFAGCI